MVTQLAIPFGGGSGGRFSPHEFEKERFHEEKSTPWEDLRNSSVFFPGRLMVDRSKLVGNIRRSNDRRCGEPIAGRLDGSSVQSRSASDDRLEPRPIALGSIALRIPNIIGFVLCVFHIYVTYVSRFRRHGIIGRYQVDDTPYPSFQNSKSDDWWSISDTGGGGILRSLPIRRRARWIQP